MCWVENGCMMYVNFFGWDIDCLFIQLQVLFDLVCISDIVQLFVFDVKVCGVFLCWVYFNMEMVVMFGDVGLIIMVNVYVFGVMYFDMQVVLLIMKVSIVLGVVCVGMLVMGSCVDYDWFGYVFVLGSGDNQSVLNMFEYVLCDFVVLCFVMVFGDMVMVGVLLKLSGNW